MITARGFHLNQNSTNGWKTCWSQHGTSHTAKHPPRCSSDWSVRVRGLIHWNSFLIFLCFWAQLPGMPRKEGRKERRISSCSSVPPCITTQHSGLMLCCKKSLAAARRYQETVRILVLLFSSAGWSGSGAFSFLPLAPGSWNFQYKSVWTLQQGAELC